MYNILEKMQEDIQLRGLSKNTENEYLNRTRQFLIWAGKSVNKLDEEKIRNYLKYLINKKHLSVSSVNLHNSELRFLFAVTLNRNLNYR